MLQDVTQEDLEAMTPEERESFRKILYLESKFWKPNKGPQTLAHESEANVILFGGAAGGGKSDLILGEAAEYAHQTIIYRRALTQSAGLIIRAKEIVGDNGDGFSGKDSIYKLPDREGLPPNRFLRFGSVPNPGDEQKYQGNPYDLICFDEAVYFTEKLFRFLTTWNRSAFEGDPRYPKLRRRVIATSNPPTSIEGEWVFNYWAAWLDENHPNPAKSGELRWYVKHPVDDRDLEVTDTRPFVWVKGEDGKNTSAQNFDFDPDGVAPEDIMRPESRTFIQSKVSDNPYYAKGTYITKLQSLSADMRDKMLHGKFTRATEENRQQVIPKAWVKLAMDRWTEKTMEERGPLDAVGVDVAMGGADMTCVAKRYGSWIDRLISEPGKNTPTGAIVADLVITSIKDDDQSRSPFINVDLNGVGHAAVGALELFNVSSVNGVMVGSKSGMTDRSGMFKFGNLRTEIFWNMRELLDPANGHDIALPPDPQLMADLCAAQWRSQVGGIFIEQKSEIKKRLHRSIDFCDAVLLAFYETRTQVSGRVSNRFSKGR